jgi:hypothetical protein
VFYAPVREAITAAAHAISRRITGQGISQQSFALATKILEAERWAASLTVPVWEVHSCRSRSCSVTPAHPTSTWSGLRERLNASDRRQPPGTGGTFRHVSDG